MIGRGELCRLVDGFDQRISIFFRHVPIRYDEEYVRCYVLDPAGREVYGCEVILSTGDSRTLHHLAEFKIDRDGLLLSAFDRYSATCRGAMLTIEWFAAE